MSPGESQGRRIGELLLADELITGNMLREALAYQKEHGGKIVHALNALGYLSIDDFVNFVGSQPGVASIDLSKYRVPPDVVTLFSREFAAEHEVFPIDKLGKLLTVGMICPLDRNAIKTVEHQTGLRVKPLLCSPDQIRNAIKHYYGGEHKHGPSLTSEKETDESVTSEPSKEQEKGKLKAGLKLEQVVILIRQLDNLPALPETVHRVRESVDDLDITPKEVAGFIAQDPPIAAKVLSVANSAAYGFPNRVDTIELAVALLGLRETFSIVLSSAVMNLFETNKRFDYGRYWETAMNCAAAARIIARAFGKEKEKSVFTAALLHSIGQVALLETVPELYTRVSPTAVGDDLEAEEMRILGMTHAEAGYELATKWGIPEEISIPIRFHKHPELADRFQESVAMVGLAARWSESIGVGEEKKAALEAAKRYVDILGTDEALISAAFDTVKGLDRARFEWEQTEPVAVPH